MVANFAESESINISGGRTARQIDDRGTAQNTWKNRQNGNQKIAEIPLEFD
jgi:hypothetical protein